MNDFWLPTFSFGRAVFIALIAVAAARFFRPWLADQRGPRKMLAWALLLAPFFLPTWLVSLAFGEVIPKAAWSSEILYLSLLAVKCIPVAVVIGDCGPPPLSPAARHLFSMNVPATRWLRLRFEIEGAGRGLWIAGGLVFLLVFAEYELASWWGIRSWTASLFVAHHGGLAPAQIFLGAAIPLLVEIAVLFLLVKHRPSIPARFSSTPPDDRLAPWFCLVATIALVGAWPLLFLTSQASAGLSGLLGDLVFLREIVASVILALCAAAGATWLADRVQNATARLALAVAGLLGAPAISLAMSAVFQLPFLRFVHNTPLPLFLTLTLLLMPLACLAEALWLGPSPALHIARQSSDPQLLRELHTRPRTITFGLLFCAAYFDSTAASFLAPSGFTPVFVRLHELALAGQVAALSAGMLVALAAPIVLGLSASALAPIALEGRPFIVDRLRTMRLFMLRSGR